MFGETRFENLISSFGKYKVNIKVIPHFVQVNKKDVELWQNCS